MPPTRSQLISPDQGIREGERKTTRQLYRDQMHEAVREAMTRAGVLAASYKFKVLSPDPRNKNFLVVMDLTSVMGDAVPQPGEMEALIIKNARKRYDLIVSAVYWRFNQVAATNEDVFPDTLK